jgi:hypothetical protein
MYFCKSFGGKVDQRGIAPPVHNGAYSCSAKKKKNYLYLIMPAKLLDFCFNLFQFFVGNLA